MKRLSGFQFANSRQNFISADMAELADAPDLGSGGKPCRFDPCYPHQKGKLKLAFFI